jgi:hypothetical protein
MQRGRYAKDRGTSLYLPRSTTMRHSMPNGSAPAFVQGVLLAIVIAISAVWLYAQQPPVIKTVQPPPPPARKCTEPSAARVLLHHDIYQSVGHDDHFHDLLAVQQRLNL